MQMIKAVIFDFDGLIVDTESIWFDAFREVLKKENVDLSIDVFAEVVGAHNAALYERLRALGGEVLDRENIEGAAHKRYHELMAVPTLREGVKDYLEAARQAGLKIGLASSSGREWVVGYLKKLDIFDYFQTIKTRNDVENVKPDPALYLKAVTALEVHPAEAFAFEDSLNGLKAANAAGIACVVVPNRVTANLTFEGHVLLLKSMSEKSFATVLTTVEKAV